MTTAIRVASIAVLENDTITILENAGLVSPPVNNKRKILSSSILSSASFTPTDFETADITDPETAIEIPTHLESKEALGCIGFSSERAASLWDCFLNLPYDEDMDDDFETFIRDNVEYLDEDAKTVNDDWTAILSGLGINERLSAAIMADEYEDLRYTSTCKHWIVEAVMEGFAALKNLNQNLKAKLEAENAVTEPEKPRRDNVVTSQVPATTIDGTLCPTADNCSTNLWHGTTQSQARAFFDEQTGEVNTAIFETSPGDLSRRRLAYWTPQKEIAGRYASWLKHKVPVAEVVLVQVSIANKFVSSLGQTYLWAMDGEKMNPVFQEYVWHCRRRRAVPAALKWHSKQAIVVANILSGKKVDYKRTDGWNSIKSEDLLKAKIDGEGHLAVQWAFQGNEAIEAFEAHCRSRVWIHEYGSLGTLRTDMC
ncbi:hypothetical protein TWF696_004544 [Orbilia brochopaga]|uniref:Uncharacterized protein n=1 Tax=Orbilia brochopaga TaxID=3140254 RepID=A0AAV9V6G2_9PEZI